MPRGIYSSPPRLDLVAVNHLYWSTSQYEGPYSERPYERGDNQYVCVICGHPRGSHMNASDHCPRRHIDPIDIVLNSSGQHMMPSGITGYRADGVIIDDPVANRMGDRTRVPFKRHWKVVPKALP